MIPLPETEIEIDEFLAAFESGTLPKERWMHGAHLLVGACYVHRLGQSSAINHMRTSVRRYNEAEVGRIRRPPATTRPSPYSGSRSLMRFCSKRSLPAGAEFAALAGERFTPQRDLFRRFYDFDVIASTEARAERIPPTLEEIECSAATHLDIARQ
jgi:hypothetical protein